MTAEPRPTHSDCDRPSSAPEITARDRNKYWSSGYGPARVKKRRNVVRKGLLQTLLDAWKSRATHALIDAVEAKGGDARAKLTTLFTIVSGIDGRLDRAIRGWAAQDDMAKSALRAVDRRRLDFLATVFLAIGFTPPRPLRARLDFTH